MVSNYLSDIAEKINEMNLCALEYPTRYQIKPIPQIIHFL